MPQVIACACGQKFSAADRLAGKTVRCPVCGRSLQVPAARAPSRDPAARGPSDDRLHISCATCGARYTTARAHIGKRLSCTKCGQPMVVSDDRLVEMEPEILDDPWALENDTLRLEPLTAPVAPSHGKPKPGSSSDSLRLATSAAVLSQPHGTPNTHGNAAGGLPEFLAGMEAHKATLEKVGNTIVGAGLVFCVMEIVPGWGFIGEMCGFEWPPPVYYVIASLCGAVGGFLAGHRYCVPGTIGYTLGAMGALFASSAPLHYVQSIHTVFLAVLGLVGFAPGYAVFLGLKSAQDALLGK